MKSKYKRMILKGAGLLLLLLGVHAAIIFLLGNVDYSLTFKTQYDRTDNHTTITTSWSRLQTTRSLLHIAYQPTCPGYIGSFISTAGNIEYEYGMFATGLGVEDFPGSEFIIRTDTIENIVLNIIEGESKFGLHLPVQNNMEWGLMIYPSAVGYAMKEELIKMMVTAKFKKLRDDRTQ